MVKEILASTGYTTVNTLGSGFTFPYGVALDGSGNVFVADNVNNMVKEILASGGSPPPRASYNTSCPGASPASATSDGWPTVTRGQMIPLWRRLFHQPSV
jgi:hypothetical protein